MSRDYAAEAHQRRLAYEIEPEADASPVPSIPVRIVRAIHEDILDAFVELAEEASASGYTPLHTKTTREAHASLEALLILHAGGRALREDVDDAIAHYRAVWRERIAAHQERSRT